MTTPKQAYEWVKTGHWNFREFNEWFDKAQSKLDENAVSTPSENEEAFLTGITTSGKFTLQEALSMYDTKPAPVATLIEHYGFTDGIVRFDGVENMEQLPIGTKLYTAQSPVPVQEPFGIWHEADTDEESDFYLYKDSGDVSCARCIKLYQHPPTAQHQPLTDEQIMECVKRIDRDQSYLPKALKQLARAIEAAHGIK